jgi:4-amino-4-deoxy-L-arabinose transferase-like glycosyltransferase
LRTRSFWFAIFLIAGAFALRVYALGFQPLWRDETDAISFATQDWGSFVSQYRGAGQNGPLYLLLLRGWITLAGEREFGLRFLSLLWSVLTVAVIYRLAADALGRRTGLIAAALAAVSPYLIAYGQDVKMYALLGLLASLILWCYWRALQGGGFGWWAGFVVASTTALLVHFFAPFLVVGAGAAYWLLWPATRPRFKAWAIAFGLLTLPYLPVALWQGPALLNAATLGFPRTTIIQVLTRQIFAFGFNSSPNLVFLAPLLALLGLLVVAATQWRSKLWPAHRFFWAYLAAPLIAFLIVNLRWPLYTERYLIILAPAFLILVAAGLATVAARNFPAAFSLGLIVFGSAGYAAGYQATTIIKPDLRTAGARLALSPTPPRILFIIPYAERPFQYYYRGAYTTLPVPPPVDPGPMLNEAMAQGPIWLLLMESDLYDPESRIPAWLDANAQLEERLDLPGVDLRRYSARPVR